VTTDNAERKNRAELLWTRAVGYYAAADPPQATADLASSDTGLARASKNPRWPRNTAAKAMPRSPTCSIGGSPVARNRVEAMTQTATAMDGETVDEICHRVLGKTAA
jgi:hypothetical protein